MRYGGRKRVLLLRRRDQPIVFLVLAHWCGNFGHGRSLLEIAPGRGARCERAVRRTDSVEVAAHFSQLRALLRRLARRTRLKLFCLASCSAWLFSEKRFD